MGTPKMVMDAARFASQSSVGMRPPTTTAKSVMTGTQLMAMGAQRVSPTVQRRDDQQRWRRGVRRWKQ
eukprot:3789346-Rhodomonas_salina.1